jgi:hypothetical protein
MRFSPSVTSAETLEGRIVILAMRSCGGRVSPPAGFVHRRPQQDGR